MAKAKQVQAYYVLELQKMKGGIKKKFALQQNRETGCFLNDEL